MVTSDDGIVTRGRGSFDSGVGGPAKSGYSSKEKRLAIDAPSGEAGRGGERASVVQRSRSAAPSAKKGRLGRSVSVKESANTTTTIEHGDAPSAIGQTDDERPGLNGVFSMVSAASQLGFQSSYDPEEEFHALLSLGGPNSQFREPSPTDDCDTWEVLAQAREHNRCFTFGVDQYGQLGQGVSTAGKAKAIRPPRSVKDGQRILHVSCGRHHSAAVTEDGHLYVWGLNDHNQLGLGKGQPGDARVLPLLKSRSGTMRPNNGQDALSSGPRIINSTAKSADLAGELRTGLGLTQLTEAPLLPTASRVASSPARCWLGLPVARVACGQTHTVAALRGVGLLAWGNNEMGQLGLPDLEPRARPTLVPPFNEIKLQTVSAGKLHTCAVDKQGRLWAWGCNRSGQCGVKAATVVEPRHVTVTGMAGALSSVACGQAHTLALSTDGEVFSWGYNAWGALGLGPALNEITFRAAPTKIEGIPPCAQVVASGISMAITQDGQLLVWGRNKWVSHPREEDQLKCVPMPLDWLAEERVSQVACSMDTAVALSEDGAIHVWGRKKQLLTPSPPEAVRRRDPLQQHHHQAGQTLAEEVRGEAVGDLSESVMMSAACGDGFCVLLAEKEFWAAPYGVLKRALHTVWKNYRQCIGKLQAVGNGPTRGGNLLRSRQYEEEDDMMSFPVLALMCKEMALIDNAVGLQQLVAQYEEVAKEAASVKLAQLPKFMQVAVGFLQMKQPREEALPAEGSRSSADGGSVTNRWNGVMAAINKEKERSVRPFSMMEEESSEVVAAAEEAESTLHSYGRKSSRKAVVAAVGRLEMKALSHQIQAEIQARTALLETPLTFSEALTVMLGLASCHLPHEKDETELLRLVAEQAATLRGRGPQGPSFLLRESCSPPLLKAVVNQSDYKTLQRIFAYLLSPHPDREDLNMPIVDIQRALFTLGDSAGVKLESVATFMREANIVPKTVARCVSIRQERDNPDLYELAQEIALRDGDFSEKVVEDRITQKALAHRDTILAEVLLELHGGNPRLDPDCVNFPDFVSLVLLMVTVRACSNNNRVVREQLDLSGQSLQYEHLMQKVKLYREKKLHPWKYFHRERTDAEIEQEVDRVFALYCTLDTTSYSVEIDQRSFRKFVKDAKLVDNRMTMAKLDILFISHVNQARRREEEERDSRNSQRTGSQLAQRKMSTQKRSSDAGLLPPTTSDTGSAPSSSSTSKPTMHRLASAAARNRRGSFARRGAEQKSEIVKLAEALKKSELGGLVQAMKGMDNDDRSGTAHREAFRLAADLMKSSNSAPKPLAGSRKRSGNIEFQLGQLRLEEEEAARPRSIGQRISLSQGGVSRRRLGSSESSNSRQAQFEKGPGSMKYRAGDRSKLTLEDQASVGNAGKRPGMRKRATALDRVAFSSFLEQMAMIKYKQEKNPYRTVVEKHLLSISHTMMDRYDSMMEELLEPDVLDLAERFSAALQQVFKSYCTLDDCLAYSHAEVTWRMMEDAQSMLSFKEFAFLAHDFGIVPGIVSIRDLEVIFRRANFTEGTEDSIQQMNYSEFVDAIGLIAMYGFGKEPYKLQYPSAVQKVSALLAYMGFEEGKADEEEDAKKTIKGEAAYKEWWALQPLDFEGAADAAKRAPGKSWYYSCTTTYPTCLIPEMVTAPPAPAEVEEHIQVAQALHHKGRFPEALRAYGNARELWGKITAEQGLTRSGELPPETKLYFAAACGGVLQSDGQDAAAMSVYSQVENEVRKLPDHHPDVALLHSLIGGAAYHMGQYDEAYVRFVRTKVMRDSLPHLGPHHVDTAVACNNLACVLDKANLVGRAIFLAREAHTVLLDALGASHPRTQAVERNLGHLAHRSFNLEELSGPLLPHPATQRVLQRLQASGKSTSTQHVGGSLNAGERAQQQQQQQEGSSRLERLHQRMEKRTQVALRSYKPSAARRLRALMARKPDAVKSTYEALRSDIELTRAGLNHNLTGQVLSGDVSEGVSNENNLLLRAGFNLRLKEPPARAKFDRVQVRTTKKFAAQFGKGRGGVMVDQSGAMVYEAVLDEHGRRLRRAPTMDLDESDEESDEGSEESD